jgi:pyridoxal phosphate enzyme (YggS family)
VTPAVAALLPELGYSDLGENRPQELWRKAAAMPSGVRWHLIGHLQRNKVERTLPLVDSLDSVDRWPLLETLEDVARRRGKPVPALLEVNASQEPNKQGFTLEELPGIVERLGDLRFVNVRGFMTMAALAEDPEDARPTFAALRQVRDQLSPRVRHPHVLEHLSMGMTNDFEVAIEEGATMIRVGTALFAGLPEEES